MRFASASSSFSGFFVMTTSPDAPKRRYRSDTLFRRVGELTITWAFVENSVDLCIDVIDTAWPHGTPAPERPRTAFGRKITYLRDWLKAAPDVAQIAPELPCD
jgi:hypothetical protein